MKYKKLVEFYEEASQTTKRVEKIEILSKFLRDLNKSDRDVMYLLVGDIYPEYDERRIGISNQLAIKAIAKSTGIEEKKVIILKYTVITSMRPLPIGSLTVLKNCIILNRQPIRSSTNKE